MASRLHKEWELQNGGGTHETCMDRRRVRYRTRVRGDTDGTVGVDNESDDGQPEQPDRDRDWMHAERNPAERRGNGHQRDHQRSRRLFFDVER